MKWTKEPPTVPGWYWRFNPETLRNEIQLYKIDIYDISHRVWEGMDHLMWLGPIEVPEPPREEKPLEYTTPVDEEIFIRIYGAGGSGSKEET